MAASRSKKLDHFYSLYDGGPILDVGVSGAKHVSQENLFLETFRPNHDLYTGLGVEDLTWVESQHPDKKFIQYPGRHFPFGDKEFNWIFCNAVIEHVEDQLLFINEMLRVANNVFFTTPYKYFPIETHTLVPLIHWSNQLFLLWLKRYRPGLIKYRINLLSISDIQSLLKKSRATHYEIYKNRLFCFPMTITVVCKK